MIIMLSAVRPSLGSRMCRSTQFADVSFIRRWDTSLSLFSHSQFSRDDHLLLSGFDHFGNYFRVRPQDLYVLLPSEWVSYNIFPRHRLCFADCYVIPPTMILRSCLLSFPFPCFLAILFPQSKCTLQALQVLIFSILSLLVITQLFKSSKFSCLVFHLTGLGTRSYV